jgi:methionyl-tRNA synthetase
MDMARLGNRYLTEQEPWKTIKTDPEAAKTALHNSLILLAIWQPACSHFYRQQLQKYLACLIKCQ